MWAGAIPVFFPSAMAIGGRRGTAILGGEGLALAPIETIQRNFTQVGHVVRDALARADLVGQTSILVYVARAPRIDDSVFAGQPVINVNLSGDFEDVSYTYSFTGELLERP